MKRIQMKCTHLKFIGYYMTSRNWSGNAVVLGSSLSVDLSVCHLHVLPMPMWGSYGRSGFFSQSKDFHLKSNGNVSSFPPTCNGQRVWHLENFKQVQFIVQIKSPIKSDHIPMDNDKSKRKTSEIRPYPNAQC